MYILSQHDDRSNWLSSLKGGGREGGREGGKEGRREVGREGGRKAAGCV